MMNGTWIPTEYQMAEDLAKHEPATVSIVRMTSPFYPGIRWAVRYMGRVLNTRGEWEHEPIPSSRDDAFYERCRFRDFETAASAATKARGAMRR